MPMRSCFFFSVKLYLSLRRRLMVTYIQQYQCCYYEKVGRIPICINAIFHVVPHV